MTSGWVSGCVSSGRNGPTLPDYLKPGLEVVFVGINPGDYSASVGKYYASPRNRFWGALNRSGLVDAGRELGPGDEAWLFDHGIGVTDVVKRASTNASSLRAADFQQWAPVARENLLAAAPLVICFNGLTAYRKFLRYAEDLVRAVTLGAQPEKLGESYVFVAPNPSLRNCKYSLDDIVRSYRGLAKLCGRAKLEQDG